MTSSPTPSRRLPSPESDLLLREVASEIGTTVEHAVGFAVDRAQDAALFAAQRLAARQRPGAPAPGLISQLARPLRSSSLVLPPAAGRTAAASSYLAMRVGLGLLGQTRDALLRMRMRGMVPRAGR